MNIPTPELRVTPVVGTSRTDTESGLEAVGSTKLAVTSVVESNRIGFIQ